MEKLEKLKKSLDNKFIPDNMKDKIRAEIKKLESEIKTDETMTATEVKEEVKEIEEKVEKALEVAEKKEEQAEAKAEEKKEKAPRKAREKKASTSETKTPKVEPKATAKKKSVFSIAKEIRKDGESWEQAKERASKMMKSDTTETKKKVRTETDKLLAMVRRNKEYKKLAGSSNLPKDAQRRALPRGKRVSQGGWKNQYGESEGGKVYYENRANRVDVGGFKNAYLENGGGVDGIIELKPLELIPLSSQLNRLSGYNWTSGDWESEDGGKPSTMPNSVIVNVHTKQKFRLSPFKIYEGIDHYNNKPLYRVEDMSEDGEYVGEWYKTRQEAEDELRELFGSSYDNGGSVDREKFNKFISSQINYIISLKTISQKREPIQNLINNMDDYSGEEIQKRITKDNLKYALQQKTVSKINEVLRISLNALKYADGGTIIGIPETPLDRGLDMDYTTLVGETGAMSSGEMFAGGGSVYTMPSFKVKFENPKYDFVTTMSPNITLEDAEDYYVGRYFDVGVYPKENMQKVVSVEYLGRKSYDYANGGYAEKGVYVETLDEEIDLSEDGRVKAIKTQQGGNKSFGELREMHGASPEALAFDNGGSIGSMINFEDWQLHDVGTDLERMKKSCNAVRKNGFKAIVVQDKSMYYVLYKSMSDSQVKRVYAEGGSLGNHGLKQGDQIIKTMSGGVQKVKTKSGDIVYVNLANGYRGDVPPLPFDGGGRLKSALMRDRKNVNYSQDYEVRYSKDKSHRSGYTKPKMSRTQFEEESFEFFDGGGKLKKGRYSILGEVDGEQPFLYATTDDRSKIKGLVDMAEIDFYELTGKKHNIFVTDEVTDDEVYNYGNGGRTRERKYVNHSEDYEVRYSKDKPHRRGYGYAEGGEISSKQLDLGYQYSFEKDEDNVGSLYKEAGVYSVIGFENGKHFSESFEKFSDAKEFYLDKKGKVKFATGGVTKNYINRNQLNTITVKKGDKKLTYKVSDVYNGAYKLEDGGNLEKMAFYIPKRNVVKVQLRDGKDVKVANGYWIKKGAKPIHTSKYDDGGSIDDFSLEKLQKKEIELAINGYQKYTEEKWKGYDYFSEKYAVNELAELELDLRRLNDGKISPTKIIGKGYKNPKKVAQEWLQSQIKKQKSIIETNGLSNKTNHSNFRHELVNAKRENIISEVKFNKLLDESNEIIESLGETYSYGGFFNDGGQLEMEYAGGGALSNTSINYLSDLWFAVQQKDTDDYEMLSKKLDSLKVPFAIQNEVSADAETQRGRKALNIPEVHDRIKKIVEKNGKKFSGGGKTTFKEKATAIAKNFEGKKVEPKYQKEYGKTYDKAEAKEVGNKIAGSQKAKYDSKMSGGGSTTKRGGAMVLAKQIRKDGESWQSALKRANEQLKK
jgi:hypothetical protein